MQCAGAYGAARRCPWEAKHIRNEPRHRVGHPRQRPHLPLPTTASTSSSPRPPYFALRSYQDGGEHYAGQIGDEPTPAEFVASLLEVTRECVRVLKPSGSLWVNLGDKYAGATRHGRATATGTGQATKHAPAAAGSNSPGGIDERRPPKSLIGIPWRYALACIDDLGLILRAEVIWSKPNGLPESVTDRVRRSHEQWFHFTLEPRYFSAVDEIREPHTDRQHDGAGKRWRHQRTAPTTVRGEHRRPHAMSRRPDATGCQHPLGKLPGSVWTVPTEPLRVPDHLGIDHFAAFPTEWPRRIIQGWSPAGVCVECGEGRRPVSVDARTTGDRDGDDPDPVARDNDGRRQPGTSGRATATPKADRWVHRLRLRLPRTHRRHPPRRRPRPLRRHRHHRDGRQSPRPPRHQRRHVRRLLPPRRMAHQRPRPARQGARRRAPPADQLDLFTEELA
jgi:DNA modification methylase